MPRQEAQDISSVLPDLLKELTAGNTQFRDALIDMKSQRGGQSMISFRKVPLKLWKIWIHGSANLTEWSVMFLLRKDLSLKTALPTFWDAGQRTPMLEKT